MEIDLNTIYGLLTVYMSSTIAREAVLRERPYCLGKHCPTENGGWSSWNTFRFGFCRPDCFSENLLMRRCSQPPPAGDGTYCPGSNTRTMLAACRRTNCTEVEGNWSPWMIVRFGDCSASCRHKVILTRSCTLSWLSSGSSCEGSNISEVERECLGGACPTDSRTDPQGHIGQWSTWVIVEATVCSPFCERQVRRSRQCLGHLMSHTHCKGAADEARQEHCVGGFCKQSTTDEVFYVVSILLIFCCIIVSCYIVYRYFNKIKKKKKKKCVRQNFGFDDSYSADMKFSNDGFNDYGGAIHLH